jgi:nucleoid DNA-binding protein
MIKTQLVDIVADDLNITRRQSKVVVESVLNAVTQGLMDDGQVTLRGFGTFTVHARSSRSLHTTGDGSPTNDSTLIAFIPGVALRKDLKSKNES